ncbi:hypothetical protein HNQ02_003301 [Flavobacterium sp. 7E]|uniref:hypothetical protein n=1 Tax=Flavobacterium sp. 7E TaxID=2735898 RepID=UPI00156EEF1D|nr:hypothetical protein [Flavobacterium sp. 7E]NRS90361.1 hypothetical protein [Flavobacterium sp. 7E]
MKTTITIAVFLFYTVTFSQIKIPKDFLELTKSPANGRKIEKVVIDFDNDSIKDVALLIKNRKETSTYKFLIYLSSLNKQYEVNLNNTDFSIYPVQLKTVKNTIQFGYFEDGTAAFGRFIKIRYNSKLKKIQVIGYDITYKSSMTEHIDKSYNLVTGKFSVKKSTLDATNKSKIEEFLGQNDFFKNNVFIEDLSGEMLKKLDDVGSKFE